MKLIEGKDFPETAHGKITDLCSPVLSCARRIAEADRGLGGCNPPNIKDFLLGSSPKRRIALKIATRNFYRDAFRSN